VSFSWDARPVLAEVDLHLVPGWTGIVGANGAGKTTLLRLIDGALRPDAGAVRVDGRVRRAAQGDTLLDVLPLATAQDRDAVRWRARLGLDPAQLDRWDTLSPGERRRWGIGAALADGPDVLLLDEPTNHLDAEARAALVDALRAFRGVGVVVAHDRALLDALTTRTVRVRRGAVAVYEGAYSAARAQWEAEEARALAALEQAQDARRDAARRLADARRQRDAATASTRRSRRMKGPHDHDGRSIGAATLAAWAETRAGRQVERARHGLARAEQALDAAAIVTDPGGAVFPGYLRCPRARVTGFRGVLRAGERVLAEVDVGLGREERIRLAGPNGAGKTTLLRALADAAPAEERLLLPQVLTADEARADLAAVRALPPEVRGRVLQHVAALGVDPSALLASAQPSPGEARKLRLALGLGRHVAALLLDEPTNDLDLPAIERLERTLAAWPGALLLVTHDDAFAAACTTAVWALDGGRVRLG
jgi:ATPase subunit of ABC transporter with duplicated ATPase domains